METRKCLKPLNLRFYKVNVVNRLCDCWRFCFVRLLLQVSLTSVWSGMGLMENNLLGAQQETRLRVEELEDR